MRIQKILVPIDYSDCSVNALKYAGEIADFFESRILLLHIIEETAPTMEELAILKEVHMKQLLKLTEEIPALSNDSIDIVLKKTPKNEAIGKVISQHNIELVVMGTNRQEFLFEELIKSNTYQTIKTNNCPVLVIPDEVEYKPIKKIGLASDFKQIDHTSALDVVLDFCYVMKADIEVFHVVDKKSDRAAREMYEVMQLQDYFSNVPYSFHEIKTDHTISGIHSFIVDHQIDLLAIMPRRHSLKDFMHKSITKDLMRHLQLPILVFQE